MSWALILLLQSAPTAGEPVATSNFDLKDIRHDDIALNITGSGARCGPADGDAIVVCGRRTRHRIEPLPLDFEEPPFVAATGLGGDVRGALQMRSVEFPGGLVSNRIMITITKPF